jgi:hypothetical protein
VSKKLLIALGILTLVAVSIARAQIASQVAYADPQARFQTVVVPFTKPEVAGDLNAIVIGWSDTNATVSSVIDSTGNQYQLSGGSATGATLSQSVYYCPSVSRLHSRSGAVASR